MTEQYYISEYDKNIIFEIIDEVISYEIDKGSTIPRCTVQMEIGTKLSNHIIIERYINTSILNGISTCSLIRKRFTFKSQSIDFNFVSLKLEEKYSDFTCDYKKYYKSDYGQNTSYNPPTYYFELKRKTC